MQPGLDGLLRDKTRPSRIPPLGTDVADTRGRPDAGPSRRARPRHWTAARWPRRPGSAPARCSASGARMACSRTASGSSSSPTIRTFADKLHDIVGLYVDPPEHAIVLSVDEKSQIQALDRTQPGLPMKKGRAGTMTHDYKRNGTTTLFAALNVLDGNGHRPVHAAPPPSGVHPLSQPDRGQVPAGKLIHVILDNYATHKHPQGPRLAATPPALHLPLHADLRSWLNAVEGFFAKLTKRRLKRGVFRSRRRTSRPPSTASSTEHQQ